MISCFFRVILEIIRATFMVRCAAGSLLRSISFPCITWTSRSRSTFRRRRSFKVSCVSMGCYIVPHVLRKHNLETTEKYTLVVLAFCRIGELSVWTSLADERRRTLPLIPCLRESYVILRRWRRMEHRYTTLLAHNASRHEIQRSVRNLPASVKNRISVPILGAEICKTFETTYIPAFEARSTKRQFEDCALTFQTIVGSVPAKSVQ